MLAESKLLEV